jgi:hypothetical protein
MCLLEPRGWTGEVDEAMTHQTGRKMTGGQKVISLRVALYPEELRTHQLKLGTEDIFEKFGKDKWLYFQKDRDVDGL